MLQTHKPTTGLTPSAYKTILGMILININNEEDYYESELKVTCCDVMFWHKLGLLRYCRE